MVTRMIPFLVAMVAQAGIFLVGLGGISLDKAPVNNFREVPLAISRALGETFLADLTLAAKVDIFLVEMVDLGETSTPSITPLRTTDGADRQARLCTTLLTV